MKRLRAMFARLKEGIAGGGAPRHRGAVSRTSESRAKARQYAVRRAPKKKGVPVSKKRVRRVRRGIKWRTMIEGV